MAFTKRTLLQLLLVAIFAICMLGADAKKDHIAVKHGALRKQLVVVDRAPQDEADGYSQMQLNPDEFSGASDEYAGPDSPDVHEVQGGQSKDSCSFVRGEALANTKTSKYKKFFDNVVKWIKTRISKLKKKLADNGIEVGINWKLGMTIGVSIYADFKQQKIGDKYPKLADCFEVLQQNKLNELTSGIFKGSIELVPNLKLEVGVEIKLVDSDYDGSIKLKFKIFDMSWLSWLVGFPTDIVFKVANVRLYFCFVLTDLPTGIDQDWVKAIKGGKGFKGLWNMLLDKAKYQLGTEASFTLLTLEYNPVVLTEKKPIKAASQEGETVSGAPTQEATP